jgi:hypothetical protein
MTGVFFDSAIFTICSTHGSNLRHWNPVPGEPTHTRFGLAGWITIDAAKFQAMPSFRFTGLV